MHWLLIPADDAELRVISGTRSGLPRHFARTGMRPLSSRGGANFAGAVRRRGVESSYWLAPRHRCKPAVGSCRMSMSTASQTTSSFTSWKEIATYLGKGVRTAQRWERELGLPVLRPNGKPSGVVSASPAELDSWRARHWSRGENRSPGRNGKGGLSLVPNERVTVAWENIRASRELRSRSQQLVQQLAQSTQNLTQECLRLSLRLKEVA